MSLGVRQALKVYSGILGLFVSLFAFIWVFFMVYLVSDTPESEHDLRMARYLDICFGLLAFFSSLALMYGAFVESKTWISAWTLGSGTVVVGMWAWYFHRKFSQTPHPEVVTDFESAGIALTVVYFLSTLPVWIFQHKIQYWDIRSMCTLEWLCPNFVLSNLPIRRSASQITHHQTNIPRSRNSNGCNRSTQQSNRLGHYLPSYAQCTTNTFLAPSHTHVNHLPASKDEDLYNPV